PRWCGSSRSRASGWFTARAASSTGPSTRRGRARPRSNGRAGRDIRERSMARIDRQAYATLFGPTTGDLVRLGDTSLLAEIERDFTVYGHELLIGAGKTFRDGEGYCATAKYRSEERRVGKE